MFSTYTCQAKSTADAGTYADLCEVKLLNYQQKEVILEYKGSVGLDGFVEAAEAWRAISGLKSLPVFFQVTGNLPKDTASQYRPYHI